MSKGQIQWYPICIRDLSRMQLITVASRAPLTGTPLELYVSRTPTVPEGQLPGHTATWRGPVMRTWVYGGAKSNIVLGANGAGTTYALVAPVTRKFYLSGAVPGMREGPIWIGVYTECLRYIPFYAQNPYPWPGFVNKAICRPGHAFSLQSLALPEGRVVQVTAAHVFGWPRSLSSPSLRMTNPSLTPPPPPVRWRKTLP